MSLLRSATLKLLLCVLPLAFITGCWNSKELNELSVVMAMGIDSIGDQYEVSLQVVDPSQMTRNRSMERTPTLVFTSRSGTIFEAIRKVTKESSRQMYLSHLKFVIFDEATAKKGIQEPLDFLFRDHQVRPDFFTAVVRGHTAKEAVTFVSPTEVLPAMDMFKALKVSEKAWAPTSAVNVRDLLQIFTKEGIEPILTGIRLRDIEKGLTLENVSKSPDHANYSFTGIGVFRDDRLVGWMNDTESKAVTYISNRVSSTVAAVKCPISEGEFAVEVISSKVKIIPSIVEDRPKITIKAQVEANIGEMACIADLTDYNVTEALRKAASEELDFVFRAGIRRAQELGSDVFGFGEAFHRKYPRKWHSWKNNWDEEFRQLEVGIDIAYQLNRMGKILNPIELAEDNKE